LSVTATDLEVELVATIDVKVEKGGEITVPGASCWTSAGPA
jgi:DNA polymerase III subunit beta